MVANHWCGSTGIRVVAVLRQLEQGPRTLLELSALVGVRRESIQRYIRMIREAGVEVLHSDDIARNGQQLPRLYYIKSPPQCDANPNLAPVAKQRPFPHESARGKR